MTGNITGPSRTPVSILGSTGSIGRQTLEVADMLNIPVVAISADRNIALLEEQVRKYKPAVAAVFDENAARDFKVRVRDLDTRVCPGAEGLVEAACADGAGTVVTAVSGAAGLLPTLAAVELGRRIAIANKETLVCAGELVMKRARERGAEIIPVDSEHSALFQCLRAGTRSSVSKLILTASGGPFRGMSRETLRDVTPDMTLRHPVWSMGRKITVDSATMMNKGLEVIEAVHLFGFPPEMIRVVVHPESVIHSLVEYADNSVLAQMSIPDMRLPIQYALTYPERIKSLAAAPDLTVIAALTFQEPDMEAFPCLGLAINAAGAPGTACSVLNGANEAAVERFLKGELGFYGIFETVAAALDRFGNITDPSLDDIIMAGEAARQFARVWNP